MAQRHPDGETLWRLTVEHSPVGMAVVTARGRVLTANRALCTMLGYTEQELVELPHEQFTHADDFDAYHALYERALAGEISTYRIVKRYRHADGSVVWGDLSVALVRDDRGEPLRFICQVLDVTARVADEVRLAEAQARAEHERRLTQAIVDTAETGLALIDSSGRYERMSRRHADFLAIAFPEGHHGWAGQTGAVFGPDGRTVLTSDEMPSIRALTEGPFDDQRIWIGEDPVTRRALSVSARQVVEDDGTTSGVALSYSDVTDLVRAVDARDQFVAAVSHELRTPLASVLNHLELLLSSPADHTDDTLRSLQVAHRNGLRLRRLVADLLSSAQDRADGLLLEPASTDVGALAREAVETARAAAQLRGVDLHLEARPDAVAEVDGLRVRQVLDNLVTNAVTYTEAGGRVDVEVGPAGDHVLVVVRDTGIGIAPEHLDRVHEPFYRTPDAKALSAPGLGLGLGVVRAIVEAHRGRSTMTSTVGEGTRVEVRLPVRAAARTGDDTAQP